MVNTGGRFSARFFLPGNTIALSQVLLNSVFPSASHRLSTDDASSSCSFVMARSHDGPNACLAFRHGRKWHTRAQQRPLEEPREKSIVSLPSQMMMGVMGVSPQVLCVRHIETQKAQFFFQKRCCPQSCSMRSAFPRTSKAAMHVVH